MAPITTPVSDLPSSLYSMGPSDELRVQMMHPADVFTVLLLLGGDVVATALAQLAGCGLAPVTFSFGWVSYSLSALLSAVGENRLMPMEPDCRCKVINGKSGYAIDNGSWILGRMMRDFNYWMSPVTKQKFKEVLDQRWAELQTKDPNEERPSRAGLVVTIYRPRTDKAAGTPQRDLVYWSGVPIMLAQLAIAAIPCGLYGDWAVLMLTSAGIGLAIAMSLLPQWGQEKWSCRPFSNDSYILTRGNGSQHAIAIMANGRGLNMEDLAMGRHNLDTSTNGLTRAAILLFSAGWIALLLCAAGLRESTWYLLAIGGVGILQNIFVAGRARRPENFGIYLQFVEVIGYPKVMKTLIEVEKSYPGLGRSMLDEFFPGELRPDEQSTWEELKGREGRNDTRSIAV